MIKQHWWRIGIILIPVILFVFAWPINGVSISTTNHRLSFSVGLNQVQADVSDWKITFNPTGTQINKEGQLKIRLDFYPSPDSKSYDIHYVNMPVITKPYPGILDSMGRPVDSSDYQEWLDKLPHEWRLNPALCIFLEVSTDISIAEIESWLRDNYDADVVATLDDMLSSANTIHYISPYTKDKTTITKEKHLLSEQSKSQIVAGINVRLAGFILSGGTEGVSQGGTPQSIDVGSGAINRSGQTSAGYTYVDLGNPANDTGVLDTVQLWFSVNGGDAEVATSYLVSGTTYHMRDNEVIGTVTAGSEQTFTGLDMDVSTDDLMAVYYVTGNIEQDSSGGAGDRYIHAEAIDTDDEADFAGLEAGRALSIYATGTEGGETPSLANSPDSENLGTVWQNKTIYAAGSVPNNPVEDGDCTFTITNDGSITENITISMTDMTGGTTWSVVSSSPGANEFRLTAYYSGQNPANGIVLSNGDQSFYNGLASSGTIKWDFKFETGTWADGDTTQRTGTLQLTAVVP